MAGRSRIGSRFVSLVAAAATLLAAWLPPGRACACGPIGEPARPAAATPEAAPVCPCCGQRLPPGTPPKPCCVTPIGTGQPTGCSCRPADQPDRPHPATPPAPTNPDDGPASVAGGTGPAWATVPPTAGPTAAETLIHSAAPPPTDLVISLSRLTC